MKISFTCHTAGDLPEAAELLLSAFQSEKVFAFYGDMGAGKTTFIKALCKELGSSDQVSSPSYSIINEYRLAGGRKIYHFDFYRIKDPDELRNIGADEFIESGEFCFIEWAELAPEFLPPRYVKVTLIPDGELRTIDMEIVS
ncbi:MAG: tRNA (adenosine(37)-N6)-threonylcarbamoyltransferase complex ATPase subunit type 1 TsaE [Bacteroidetes bacterium]|nr:tRNA (adenosine(37)-N6)-threonylcarbamoyltransferase complex ATPase subunit type 1 TsaE [Bacteroidota bacterium]